MTRLRSLGPAECNTCGGAAHPHGFVATTAPITTSEPQTFATDAFVKMVATQPTDHPGAALTFDAGLLSFAANTSLARDAALPALAAAQAALVDRIDQTIERNYPALEAFYQDLHRHPELSLKEKETAAKVAAEFKRLGLETLDNIGGGVVGILRNGPGPVSVIRSELDALPVTEETNLPYKSEVPGVMHACGHDLHTTAVIGVAEVMLDQRDKWTGTLVFLAQPAEEVVKGAQAMIDAGLASKIPKPHNVIALHTAGVIETGKVGFPPAGPVMAAADNIDVILRGVGAHGAHPDLGVDPIVLGSEFVLKMQTLIGREVDPIEPAVITVGSFHGGTKHNIISDTVKLQLTLRTYSKETRDLLVKRINEIARDLSKASRAPDPTVTIVESTPVVFNNKQLLDQFRASVTAALPSLVVDSERTTSSEDFGVLADALGARGLRFVVGARDDRDPKVSNHSPKFAPVVKTVLPLAIKSTAIGVLDLHKPARR